MYRDPTSAADPWGEQSRRDTGESPPPRHPQMSATLPRRRQGPTRGTQGRRMHVVKHFVSFIHSTLKDGYKVNDLGGAAREGPGAVAHADRR